MTSDVLNKNTNIKYDHRNLILELTHTKYILNDSLIILTKYYYDESGNRIRKMSYNTSNNSLMNDIVYSRDVSGRELAIYENGSIDQWNIYGMDNIGFIDGNEDIRFYMKDHLGSVRAVTDGSGGVISSQDYDAWGYLLENRVYESDESIYKFTSKERDEESFYDYFGARYYDARIANWTSIDPLMEKHYDFSPYNYVLRNPLKLIDPDGAQVNAITDFLNVYTSYTIAKIESDYYNSLSLVGKQQHFLEYSKSMGSSGRIEATGDELLLVPIAMKTISTVKQVAKSLMTIEKIISLEKQAIQISEGIGKSGINIGYGRLDLTGKSHVIKLGGGKTLEIPTPHLKPFMYNYSPPTAVNPLGVFHMKTVRDLTRSATNEDLTKAIEIINSKF